RYLCGLYAALLLGIFNKLDFLAFAAALAVAAMATHAPQIRSAAGVRTRSVTAASLVFAAGLLVLYLKFARPAEGTQVVESHAPIGRRLSDMWSLFTRTMDGSLLHEYMTGEPVSHATVFTTAFIPVLIAAAVCSAWWAIAGRRGNVGSRLNANA